MKHRSSIAGVSLVETLVAVLILSIGVLGMVGLQARSTTAISDSQSRAEAVISSERLIALIWNDQANAVSYASTSTVTNQVRDNWLTELQTKIPSATAQVTVTPTTPVAGTTRNQIDITICWKDHGDPAPPSAGFACDASAYASSYNRHRVVAFLEPAR